MVPVLPFWSECAGPMAANAADARATQPAAASRAIALTTTAIAIAATAGALPRAAD